MPACTGSAGYWLETTPPNTATASPGRPSPDGKPAVTPTASPGSPSLGGKPTVTSAGSSCQVTVTFSGLQGIPTAAALVLDQSGTLSVISLTVSRNVGLSLYLVIPIITGLALAFVTFFWALLRVRACFGPRADGRTRDLFDPDMLHRYPIVASGAWTLGDSWATNISTGVVVVGSVLGVTAATSTLFPGVALDRFAIVNIAAAGIVSFAPFIFGILYAGYTRKNPGPSADARVLLPMATRLAAATAATVPEGTTVRRHRVRTARLGQDERINLASNTLIAMPRGGPVSLASKTAATLPAGATVTLRSPDGTLLPDPTQVQLPEGAEEVQLPENAALALTGLEAGMMLLPTGADKCKLPLNTAVTLPDGRAGVLTEDLYADVPSGALVTLPTDASVTLPTDASVTLTDRFIVTLGRARSREVRLPPETAVRLDPPVRSELCALTRPEDPGGQVVKITVVSGAAITVLAGATIAWQHGKNDKKKWSSAAVQAGKTIQVSAGSQVLIPAGVAIALPGGSDIPVPAGTAISLGDQGTLAMAGGDLAPPPKSGNSSSANAQAQLPDLMVSSPACISVPGGAKITVTGSAVIEVPAGTVITPPHYRQVTVPVARELQVPQASYVIIGNLYMTLVAAFVTMLGIGAEFGIAGVLAFGLSEASQLWRSLMLVVIVAAGLGVLYYAITAIAALADPQPGSSLSAKSGTSFTL
jgi:hypothetical protein